MSVEGIICIIITILFGVIGLPSFIVAVSKKKYPKKIEFYVLDMVQIISPLVHKYDSIKLLHNNKETSNVAFLRSMCMCVGDEDVALKSDMPQGDLRVVLPKEYKWLEVRPQENSQGLEITCTIDSDKPNEMHVTSNLFKRDEAFTFDAYIEGKDDSHITINNIEVCHRINNMGKIHPHKFNLSKTKARKRKLWTIGVMCVLYIILAAVMAYGVYYDRPIRYVEVNNHQDSTALYSATLVSDSVMAVSKGSMGVLPWKNESMSIKKFNDRYCIYAKSPTSTIWGLITTIGVPLLLCVTMLISLVIMIIFHTKEKKVFDAYVAINGKI